MAPLFLALLGLGVVLFLWYRVKALRQNIDKAKSSGLPYRILPFHILSFPWALSRRFLLPLLDGLSAQVVDGRMVTVR